MHRAITAFDASIQDARSLSALYDYLVASVPSPFSYDDLLRAQVVYSVSAFDKLIHELIRIGMVDMFVGRRPPTSKYKAESISIEFHTSLLAAAMPPKEILFEQEIGRKLKALSFQDPPKVADGLAYIWEEKDKWLKIGVAMGLPLDDAKVTMKLIVGRRNAIVHESDSDPLSNVKNSISRSQCKDITDFIERCGRSIGTLVIQP